MATIVQANNISKSYGVRTLFSGLDITINEGDKTALIAPNGSGKSSLLKILSGVDSSDKDGVVRIASGKKVIYLEQEPIFDPSKTIFEELFAASEIDSSAIIEYEKALASGDSERAAASIKRMDEIDAWSYELHIRQILSELKIEEPERKMSSLSGGEKKRVAIARIMVQESDLLILDEPTNHLDLEIIEYLEEYLKRTATTLLMVTHDRYFLDRVCTSIIELDNGKLYTYLGNYSYFLEKRGERIEQFNTAGERARNLYRGELEWMRRMPQARATKAKYRINAFYELKDRAFQTRPEGKISIDIKSSRLGSKIVNCKKVCHYYDNYCTIDDFTYNFNKGEKIGFVGANGVGKTTLLNLLTGELPPLSGEIDRGETIVFGYYNQNGLQFNPEDTVIDAVREIAEVVTTSDGVSLSVDKLLTRFLFPHSVHNNKISTLSGGERRRLYLVTVLMRNPNFLILDEPTNDLDIMSLNVLEEYLISFKGCVIIVSHDRYFLDKLADHIFVFEGNGLIKDYVGKYSEYRELMREQAREKELAQRTEKVKAAKLQSSGKRDRSDKPETGSDDVNNNNGAGSTAKRKLSFKEKKELESLEVEIEQLESEKASLEQELSSGTLSPEQLNEYSRRFAELLTLIEDKSNRWVELSEM
jgi:ATPase components of ABC transporters with duplicated ATPase domains